MEKSVILPWSKENIEEKAPDGCGVLMLRTTPVNGDIILIEVSDNLKKDFLMFFDKGMEDVKYFDWYSTDSIDDAKVIKTELSKRYHIDTP